MVEASRAELAASRARIVAATDDERRRVVRDLHDGAQARLVHTVVTLKMARRAVENGEDELSLCSPRRSTMPSARRPSCASSRTASSQRPSPAGGCARGWTRWRHGCRCRSRSTLGGPAPHSGRGDPLLRRRRGAYQRRQTCSARRAEVTARVEDGTLAVHVRDDGMGGARSDGSGLLGLADRLAALDGQLRVEVPHRRRHAGSRPPSPSAARPPACEAKPASRNDPRRRAARPTSLGRRTGTASSHSRATADRHVLLGYDRSRRQVIVCDRAQDTCRNTNRDDHGWNVATDDTARAND